MGFFENKIQHISSLLQDIWKNREFPEKETFFNEIGEDYSKPAPLVHSGDAINPIYDNAKFLYSNIESLQKADMEYHTALLLVKQAFEDRES